MEKNAQQVGQKVLEIGGVEHAVGNNDWVFIIPHVP